MAYRMWGARRNVAKKVAKYLRPNPYGTVSQQLARFRAAPAASAISSRAVGIAGGAALAGGTALYKRFNKPKKPKLMQGVKHQADRAGTSSCFKWGRIKKVKNIKALATLKPTTFVENSGQQAVSGLGLQNFTTVAGMLTSNSDLTAIYGQLTSSGLLSSTQVKTAKVYIQDVKNKVTIMNSSSFTGKYVIFDISLRHDCTDSSFADPVVAIKNLMPDEAKADGTSNSATAYQAIGWTPFCSKDFTHFYKVNKMTFVELSSGQTHTHESLIRVNRWIDGQTYRFTPYGVKGLTHYTVVQQYGTPCFDGADHTKVSISESAMDVIVSTKIVYYWSQQDASRYIQTNTLPQAFTGAEQSFNVYTGQTGAFSD